MKKAFAPKMNREIIHDNLEQMKTMRTNLGQI
jgi:hypothetical protein